MVANSEWNQAALLKRSFQERKPGFEPRHATNLASSDFNADSDTFKNPIPNLARRVNHNAVARIFFGFLCCLFLFRRHRGFLLVFLIALLSFAHVVLLLLIAG
jgi:hypothetical protein